VVKSCGFAYKDEGYDAMEVEHLCQVTAKEAAIST